MYVSKRRGEFMGNPKQLDLFEQTEMKNIKFIDYTDSFKSQVPYGKMYQASRKEASRKKPVFFIHKYFARRITANFRLSLLDFFQSTDIYNDFYKPSEQFPNITVLDPFMGGGTTIFESLRFGCKVIGSDLQPLSKFVTKALIEPIDEIAVKKEVKELETRVGNRIRAYYKTKCPCCNKDADVMYAFHVKTVKTKSACNYHRLFSTFIIAYKNNEFTVVCPKCGKVDKTKFDSKEYKCSCGWTLTDPKDSYIKTGVFSCPDCDESFSLSDASVTDGYPFASEIIALEYYCPHCKTHDYKAPESADLDLYKKACEDYLSIKEKLPIPDQEIPEGYNTNQILNHNYKKFSDLFNQRQLLCLGLLLDEINKTKNKKTQLWLQLAFSGMLEMNNMFCRYQQNAFKICNIFFNHAYVPISMPVENCVWGTTLGTGTFEKTINKIIKGKRFNTNIYDIKTIKKDDLQFDSLQIDSTDSVEVNTADTFNELSTTSPFLNCGDSRNLSFILDNSVDLVLTDPPYGANVMYSELIDFFHVWNYKSSIASELGFIEPLSPKLNEIIVNPIANKDFSYYQDGITSVFSECYKKLKNNGFLVFSFHDKSLDSWIAILNSISESGYKLVKCFPVQAETRTGAHTSNKNSIGLDIMLICQKDKLSNTKTTYTISSSILENTRKAVIESLEELQYAEAEVTMPDIENIYISKFFTFIPNYNNFDNLSKEELKKNLEVELNNLDEIANNFSITEKRNGWWSELYKQKWDI